MPRTIEHQVRLLDRAASPPLIEARDQGHFKYRDGDRASSPQNWARRLHQHSFDGDEETYGTEMFERTLHYSPNEVDRRHSTRSFGEKHSLGEGGEGGTTSVRFESSTIGHPMGTTSTVDRESRPTGQQRLLSPSRHLNTTPIRLPRIRLDGSGEDSEGERWVNEPMRNRQPMAVRPSVSPTADSGHFSTPSSTRSCATTPLINVPLKKVVRKARLVSIHDGRPLGSFVETVHYEPLHAERTATSERRKPWHRQTPVSTPRSDRNGSRHAHFSPELWTSSSSCSLSSSEGANESIQVVHNPLYVAERRMHY